jgi:hypothetical protein
MAAVSNKPSAVEAPFANAVEVVRVRYDYSVDGGAIGALDLVEAKDNLVLVGFYAVVQTAVTSSGAATVSIGDSASASGIVATAAIAEVAAGKVVPPESGTVVPRKLAAGDKITQTVAAFALTAGVIDYVFMFAKY